MPRPPVDRNGFLEEAMPHAGALFRTARRVTRDSAEAEDLVQDTFHEAWKSFHLYQPGTHCKAWLFRILFRLLSRSRRSRHRFTAVPIEQIAPSAVASPADAETALKRREILEIVQSLPGHYQPVLVLVDVEGFSYREAAEMLEIPIGTVMSRLNRARGLFRELYRRDEKDREWTEGQEGTV